MKDEQGPGLGGASADPVVKRRYEPPLLTPESRGIRATAKTFHSAVEFHLVTPGFTSQNSGPS